ncbi:MAG: rod shape-determining protein MreC [Pseudomonadota bacterium]
MTVSLFGFKAAGLKRQQYVWSLMISLVKGSLLTLQRIFIIMMVVLACVYAMVVMRIDHPILSRIKTISLDLTMPLLQSINQPIVILHHQYKKLRDFNQLQTSLDSLQKENFQLEEWKSLALQLKRENQNLRELLRTLPSPDQSFFTAKVLGSPAGGEHSTLLIAATEADGVEKNAVVVCAKGVVGRVVETGLLVSRVTLLTDINARTPVRFESTGEHAILAGTGKAELVILHRKSLYEMPLENTEKTEVLKVGDRLVTSGFGGIFPPDLAVAIVTRIEKDPAGDKVLARLIATPQTLEFVRIFDALDAQDSSIQVS